MTVCIFVLAFNAKAWIGSDLSNVFAMHTEEAEEEEASENQDVPDFTNPQTPNPFDLSDPPAIEKSIEYDPETNMYIIREKVGGAFYSNPQYLTFEEYLEYESKRQEKNYWNERTEAITLIERPGIIPQLHLDANVLDRVFGGSTVDIRPSGNIDLTFGGNFQRIDNPTLTEQQRRQGGFDFDMNINMNVIGTIGDKLKMNASYNTEQTFDFENEINLEYTGEEDEIIQKIEAGNVSFPLNTSLIQGNQSLFGVKTQMQFGRLTVTGVVSQQKSQMENIQLEGGAQIREFEVKADQYDENRHFFLAHYFRDNYNQAMSNLPLINSLANITRIEVWVTNKRGVVENAREVVGFMDLGEPEKIHRSDQITRTSQRPLPANGANDLYSRLNSSSSNRNANNVVNVIQGSQFQLEPVQDFEKTFARKLSSNEFTYNAQLGYISLNQTLQPDEMLAVSFEYTFNGEVFKVGEFAQDVPPDSLSGEKVLYLKMLKSTSVRPKLPIWDLMMKNIYSIGAFQINREDFQLDVYYADPGGGIKRYIPAGSLQGQPLIRVLNLDNLNQQLDPQPDGRFDFIPGITINPQNGRIIFPVLEPFGADLRSKFSSSEQSTLANNYVYDVLYDSTKTVAMQFPEFNRYLIRGRYKSEISAEISLGAFNIPEGSIQVSAGGQQLVEGTDYTVDYNLGRVRILNEGILNSGIPINVSYENSAQFGVQTKTFLGARLDYWISDNFTIGGTILRLNERPFTRKVNVGDDPIANTMYGLDVNYSTESEFITWLLNRLPFYESTQTSSVNVTGEVAHLSPGHSRAIGREGTVYIDDFEGTRSAYDMKFPSSRWVLASTPRNAIDENGNILFPEAELSNDLRYGFNRARLAWYNIDPLFLRNISSTPDHIRNDPDQQSNHYVREVLQREVFPNKDDINPGIATTIQTLDLALYPSERGPYNFESLPNGSPGISSGILPDGRLREPSTRWGGVSRSIQNNDFEASNIEFIEFWVLDPFIYDSIGNSGYLYFNLGNVSEDILKDSRMFFENGLPGPNSPVSVDTTIWGKVPNTQPITNAFDNDPDVRAFQDLGFNGLNDEEERAFFQDFLNDLNGYLDSDAYNAIFEDPAGDNFQYYRSSELDNNQVPILERYKRYNNPQGNSPVQTGATGFSSAATNLPDSEDLNRDNTLNESEEYFQYRVRLEPGMDVGDSYITDKVEATVNLRNGNQETVTWYQFKIPIDAYDNKVGNIPDFRSIRFMRMFLTGFEDPVVLRFARLELVRSQWRRYRQSLLQPGEYIPSDNIGDTYFNVSAVNIEENSDRQPIPYVLAPGIEREQLLGAQNYVALQNEQSISLEVCDLQDGDARAVYRNIDLDLRLFRRMRMFIHAESLLGEVPVNDGEVTAFIRLGSDFKDNYYEYEIPLTITEPGITDPQLIWPEANEMNFPLDSFVLAKQLRNEADIPPNQPFTITDDRGNNITIVGNPDLGLVQMAMLGIRNPKAIGETGDDGSSKCAEVWFNELRLTGFDEEGGWAALGRVDIQLADLGSLTLSANMHTIGFGQIEQKLDQRYRDNFFQYDVSTNLELGRFLPDATGLRLPMFASLSQSFSTPQYDPYEMDIKVDDKLRFLEADERRDYRRTIQDLETIRSINFTNVRRISPREDFTPRIYSIENWNLTYAFTETQRSDPFIESDLIQRHRLSLGYNFAPTANYFTPFENLFGSNSSKYFDLIKDININFIPSNLRFSTDFNRQFGEQQLRMLGDEEFPIDPTYNKNFTWDRLYGFQYNPFRSLNIDFSATNRARIDEPEGRLDTREKRDSVWRNVQDFGRNIEYSQSASANYNVPINKIPILDWIQLRTGYATTYNWRAGPLFMTPEGELGPSPYGNTIENSQNVRINGEFNLRNLYNKWTFLRPYNSNMPRVTAEQRETRLRQRERLSNDLDQLRETRREQRQELRELQRSDEENEAEIERKEQRIANTNQQIQRTRQNRQRVQVPANPFLSPILRPVLSLKRISATYTENRSTFLPGYLPTTRLLGMDDAFEAPGFDFIFGYQPGQEWLDRLADEGRITSDTNLNYQFRQTTSKNLNVRANLEPFRDLRVDLTFTRTESENYTEYFKRQFEGGEFQHLNPTRTGSYSISFLSFQTMFNEASDNGLSETFKTFEQNRRVLSQRFAEQNPNSIGGFQSPADTIPSTGYAFGYGPYSQDVLIPSFLAAYTDQNPNDIDLSPFRSIPLPNWRVTYNGLSRIPFLQNILNSANVTHGYNSTYTVNSFITEQNFEGVNKYEPEVIDTLTGNFFPEINIPQIVISEQFSPLFGIDITWKNNITTRFEYKKSRNLSMSFIDYRLNESKTTETTVGLGYRITGLNLPIRTEGRRIRLENDLNIRFDFSIRDNITITHRLDQNIEEPVSGMRTIRFSPSIDYVINRRLNIRLFFDRNRTIPATSASFPITNTRAGVTIRFSLAP